MLKRIVGMAAAIAVVALGLFLFTAKSNFALSAAAHASLRPQARAAVARQIAVPPPPMGWSSWNSFSNTIDSKIAMEQAKAMVSSGMKQAGYQYINIDEGWWLGTRDANGNITVDAKQWPALQPGEHNGDMSNIATFIHGLGLKAGIYTDAGEAGCGFYGPDLGPPMPHTGSEGHYNQDFLQFAEWGFDYVKVDWCGGDRENLDPSVQYAEIAHAINRAEKISGHRLYYSICNWGSKSPWTWAPGIGGVAADIWRTSGDIVAPIVANTPNASRRATIKGVLDNFDQGIHPFAQHTGFYNDPDMMMVGMPGLSETQNRVHMSLWAISGAPLIVGADLTKLDKATTAILTNADVLAVDQDSLGVQAIKVAEAQPGLQVWARPLMGSGAHAVLLLNRNSTPAEIAVNWDAIGLDASTKAAVKDLWADKELGSFASVYSATVPAGDAVFLIVRGTDANPTHYNALSVSFPTVLDGGATAESCKACPSGSKVPLGGEKSLTFRIAAIKKPTFVEIHYVNMSPEPVPGQLRVDGQIPTNISFPPTGTDGEVGSITIEVESNQTGPHSTLTFTAQCVTGPALESISVLAGAH
jgi:Alpha galactosidase A/Alpha galactosidase C-terminal beta sandwich domain